MTVSTTSQTKRTIYFIAAVAAMSGLLFGFDIAVINGALIFLRAQFALSDSQTETVAGALLLGCVAGSMVAGWASDHFGRKKVLSWSAILFAASSAAAALANTVLLFEIARVVGGVAIGVASMLAPLYISEISPARIRGRLVSFNQLAIVIGILLAYVINWGLSFVGAAGWRWMFAFAALPSVLLLIGLYFVPESPRWLVERGNHTQARKVLASVEDPDRIDAVLAEIEAFALEDRGKLWDLIGPQLRRPTMIAIVLAILQQITGINTVLFYGTVIFEKTIFPHQSSAALAANITLGAVNLIATIISLAIIDRVGRKPLLMLSAGTMGLCELGLVLGFRGASQHPAVILISMLLCVAAFAMGMGTVVWVLLAEIFPTSIRGRAMSVATVCLWLASWLLTSTFLTLVNRISISGAFGVYASLCFITLIFTAMFVPETAGLSLEQIENFWKKTK
jgi:SP family arabinose:H+ symporter-like MFS transporter